jgi:hypothetical protein
VNNVYKKHQKIVMYPFSTSMQCGNLESYTGSGHAQQAMKSFMRMLIAQQAIKSFPRMLSKR